MESHRKLEEDIQGAAPTLPSVQSKGSLEKDDQAVKRSPWRLPGVVTRALLFGADPRVIAEKLDND